MIPVLPFLARVGQFLLVSMGVKVINGVVSMIVGGAVYLGFNAMFSALMGKINGSAAVASESVESMSGVVSSAMGSNPSLLQQVNYILPVDFFFFCMGVYISVWSGCMAAVICARCLGYGFAVKREVT